MISRITKHIFCLCAIRFRKYFGKQYRNSDFYTFVRSGSGAGRVSGIPILPIYFLGEPLEGFEETPLILIDRVPVDLCTRAPFNGTNPFLNSLFHKSAIQLLLEMGLPKDEVTRKLGLSEGDMERY